MEKVLGFSAGRVTKKLGLCQFDRQPLGEYDLRIQVLYCGVCHSDIHQVNNDWKNTVWPCVPGHEIVGKVVEVGQLVEKFQPEDLAAVGCMIDSCGICPSCKEGNEQYCESETSFLATYNGAMLPNGQNTFGGYSSFLVVKESFALKVPSNLDLKSVAPILCAGVTTYSPLRHFGIQAGNKVGIIGLGGLGHMATQIAHKMGAEVTVITTSPDKIEDARRLGATEVIVSTDVRQMRKVRNQYDFLLSTIPEKHDIDPYLELLKRDGILVLLGVLVPEPGWNPQKVILRRRRIGGSLIGSIRETQEVLDFCSQHQILPQVEVIPIDRIHEAFQKVMNKEVRYRYVINMASIETLPKEGIPYLGTVESHLEPRRWKTAA